MTDAQRNTIIPATGWSRVFWLMIIFSAWSSTASAGMVAAATDITAPSANAAAVAPVAEDGEVALPEELSTSDWQSIRAAYDANRHAVRADDEQPGSYRARNPGQQWLSTFNAKMVWRSARIMAAGSSVCGWHAGAMPVRSGRQHR